MESKKLYDLEGEIQFTKSTVMTNFESARMILSHLIDDIEKLGFEDNPVFNEILTKSRGIHCLLDVGVREIEGHSEKSLAIVEAFIGQLNEKKA